MHQLISLTRHIEFWEGWARTASRRAIQREDRNAIALIRVSGGMVDLFFKVLAGRFMTTREAHRVEQVIADWEGAPFHFRMGVLTFYKEVSGEAIEHRLPAAVEILAELATSLRQIDQPVHALH